MPLTKDQLDSHADHLHQVLRMTERDGGKSGRAQFQSALQGLCVAFQAAAPDNQDVKALARRLMQERFDDSEQQDQNRTQAGPERQAGAGGLNLDSNRPLQGEAAGAGRGPLQGQAAGVDPARPDSQGLPS